MCYLGPGSGLCHPSLLGLGSPFQFGRLRHRCHRCLPVIGTWVVDWYVLVGCRLVGDLYGCIIDASLELPGMGLLMCVVIGTVFAAYSVVGAWRSGCSCRLSSLAD